jgi:starch synthase
VIPWPDQAATGIGFSDVSIAALLSALQQAEQLYLQQPAYRAVQLRGMQQNFSWQSSVQSYIQLYQQALTEQFSRT